MIQKNKNAAVNELPRCCGAAHHSHGVNALAKTNIKPSGSDD